MKKRRPVNRRGNNTVELPFLASCMIHLLDHRFWILGVRYPFQGIRFDVLAKVPGVAENVVLVEAKFRSDGRPVRPYEVRRFVKEIGRVKKSVKQCHVTAFFMTNTRLSQQAIEVARRSRIRTFQNVPLLFGLEKPDEEKRKVGNGEKQTDGHKIV